MANPTTNPINNHSARAADEDGLKTVWLTEIEDGKLEEALDMTNRRLVEYMNIEGYRFKIETLMTFEYAMPLIGLEMPPA